MIVPGIIQLSSCADWVYDEVLAHGTNVTLENAEKEMRDSGMSEDDIAEAMESYEGYEDHYFYNKDGLELELSYLGGAPLITVLKSIRVKSCPRCSPCCPGSGDLDSTGSEVLAFALPDDWLRGRA